ncbi:two-component system sensor histidine kinase MprB [Streptomyces sp. 1114.5]|uniref:HAMP domain-containing sensor histidine kinase n=1 Tax=unclassified Streptomyces TaxID=2593676 RepID=UPI000BD02BEB|nr:MULTISPECIES: HAMP domain-containing sensor histidine kinase [unclassified Streptomyces]RKT16476.1 two-component system sensor histidine kinase MprB [Streptomyces sp. 1114.5]SOB82646.1 two-component system, OmpR family, sensor histidine kinase MprB [Streptomyces sp. 1331.2]
MTSVPPPPLAPPRTPGRRRRLVHWFRSRSLRSRLTFLSAAAVAVAIALSALACWFIVEKQLYNQVRTDLANAPLPPRVTLNIPCPATPEAALAEAPSSQEANGPVSRDTQYVLTNPVQVCLPPNATRAIVLKSGDTDAFRLKPGQSIIRDGQYTNGDPAIVRISTARSFNFGPVLVMVATPTQPVEDSLQGLAILLGSVSVGGILLAAVAGRLVAHSSLKPVDQLTDAVEHIARTEEVGTTIPVHGDDEIARLSTSFNSMSTALANSRERQTRLIADAGHELRTPLTSLRTNVDLLIRSNDTGRPLPAATKTKLLGNMKAQMQELTVLIGDLLQLSRPDSPKTGPNLAVVALHEIAGRAVERAKLRGPGLVFETSTEPWYVHGDAAGLERAVINLLDNAVKYSPPGGTIDIRLRQGVLTVRDHGPGIPPDELQYVFDRFWRSPSSRQLPGSGLGLSIVAQSVRDAGGEVTLGPATDGGPGALATVRLPGGPAPE